MKNFSLVKHKLTFKVKCVYETSLSEVLLSHVSLNNCVNPYTY